MKRRKNLNKYTIGVNGEIKNNNPVLSKQTRDLLNFMAFAEVMREASENIDIDEEDADAVIDDETATTNTTANTTDDDINDDEAVEVE